VGNLKLGVVVILLGMGLGSCDYWSPSPDLIAVGKLQQLSSQTKEIYLKGQVSQVVNLLDEGAYQLQDSTGKIWVITQDSLPQLGDEILIRGQLRYESIPVGQLELGEVYVVELEQIKTYGNAPTKPQQGVILPAETDAN
jgi:hypothetical protein